jgi:hypothetical protein
MNEGEIFVSVLFLVISYCMGLIVGIYAERYYGVNVK